MFTYTPERSGRLGRRGWNLIMMRAFAVAGWYFESLLAWRCGNGFCKELRNATAAGWCR